MGRPNPAAKWDYYDATAKLWVPGQTTDQIWTLLANSGTPPDHLWVRPTGTKMQKVAADYGFVDDTAPVAF